MTPDTTAAPPRLCRQCGRPEHGTAACSTVAPLSADEYETAKELAVNILSPFGNYEIIDTATHAAVTHEEFKRLQQHDDIGWSGLATLYKIITGNTCDKGVALGVATSAVGRMLKQLTAYRQQEERLRELVRTSRQCLNQTHELKSIGDALESILNTTDTKEKDR